MIHQVSLPHKLWDEAISTTAYLINHMNNLILIMHLRYEFSS